MSSITAAATVAVAAAIASVFFVVVSALLFEMSRTGISVGLCVFRFPPSVVGNSGTFPANVAGLATEIALVQCK